MDSSSSSLRLKITGGNSPRYCRMIDIKDFLVAGNIHRVSYPDFHNERIPSLQLSSEDQKRPEPIVTTKNGL